jgi:nucleotide-binding universal stress UspA family protein
MFAKIVVTLDGSKLAEVALPYAEELAAKMGYDIVLLTILNTQDTNEYENHLRYAKKIEEITKYHAVKYTDNGKGKAIDVTTVTRYGNPAEGIMEYAISCGFPLIVMASHGRSGIGRWTVGSVADKVVRSNYYQPVMLIRAKESRSDIREKRIMKKALVPLDGSNISEMVIPYITQIAAKLEMELTLLQVVPTTNHVNITEIEAHLQSVCSQLKENNITVNYKVNIGGVAENIIDFADEFAFDLVAMSTCGMNRGDIFSLGSIAQKVFLGGNTPLLLIKK